MTNNKQLLRSIRKRHAPEWNHTGIPPLDKILDIFTKPVISEHHHGELVPWESSQQQHHHDHHQHDRLEPQPVMNIKTKTKPPVIEIAFVSSSAQDLQIIYQIVVLSLLPATVGNNNARLNGKGGAVVWIDSDNRFDIVQLRASMVQHIKQAIDKGNSNSTSTGAEKPKGREGERAGEKEKEKEKANQDPTDIEKVVETALQHLHVFQPQSADSLIATLRHMPEYLFGNNNQTHHSQSRALQSIILTNLSSFLWETRMEELSEESEIGNMQSIPNRANANANKNGNRDGGIFVRKYRDVVEALRRLQELFDCTVIASNIILSHFEFVWLHGSGGGGGGGGGQQPAVRPHVPKVWNNFCAVRLIVRRNGVTRFGPGISAQEALLEAPRRQEAVDRSGFTCWVNAWGREHWGESVRNRLQKLGRSQGAFSYGVDGYGIELGGNE